jgi:mannonate dehydratase
MLRFAAQMGASGVVLNTPLPPSGATRWTEPEVTALRRRVESFGLRLEAIENIPLPWYERVILGLDGAEEQLLDYVATVEAIGAAGVPVLGFHWMANGVKRTGLQEVRGGAKATAWDLSQFPRDLLRGRVFPEDELWSTFERFLARVLPVAERAGVRLALHPDDPPVKALGGVPHLFSSFANFRRALDGIESDHLGLDFCVGSWSEMAGGAEVLDAIAHFGRRILYVHFRDVKGGPERFHETFLGEGNLDPLEVMLALRRAGFDGFVIDDHVPQMEGDSGWNHRGRALATGYLMGMLESMERFAAV